MSQPDHEFRREYLLRLPLPLAQLYSRAHNAPAPRARHDNTFYLFEALIKLTASPLVAYYLRRTERGGERDGAIDRLLAQLALPSLGQWVGILRELARHYGDRPDAASHSLGHLWKQLTVKHRDLPGLLNLYRRIKNGPDGEPGNDTTCSLLQVIDALVAYRNHVFGHGAGRFESFYEQEMGPLMLPAANELLDEGVLDVLGPKGSRLVYLSEIRRTEENRVEVAMSDLVGLQAERMMPLTLSEAEARDLAPSSVAVIWPSRPVPIRLDPLLVFRGREVADEVLFLNRDRSGRQVEYLSYTTGSTERDKSMAPAMTRLLSRITGRDVQESELREMVERSLVETPSVEALFEPEETERRTIGDYEILAEIGRGGMGVVYLGRQLSLGRLVALKMLPADLQGNELALARFRREMRVLGRCEHPHIVKVLSSGTLPDGQLFYSMEYVPGADLDMVWRELSGSDGNGPAATIGGTTWGHAVLSASRKQRSAVERKAAGLDTTVEVSSARETVAVEKETVVEEEIPELPLPPLPDFPQAEDDLLSYSRHVARMLRDAASAVQAVHDQHVVHRDIKPANLLLTADGSRVVLMDFGLAKGTGQTVTAAHSGDFLGTLRYAAPEQLATSQLPVGPPADVRALGVTLWELLTRRRLFEDADDRQLPSWVLTRDVPTLRSIDPTLDRDLEAIVARAVEREPERRIQTAREFAQYLDLYLEGKPLPIRPPGAGEVVWQWIRQRKALVGTAATALLAVVVTIVVSFIVVLGALEREKETSQQLADTVDELETTNKALDTTAQQLNRTNQSLKSSNQQLAEAAETQRKLTLEAKRNAELAREREQKAQLSLYIARIRMADQSLDEGEFSRALDQLDMAARTEREVDPEHAKLRGWEWYYLQGLIRAGMTELRKHEAPVTAVATSRDGRYLASGDAKGVVYVWDLVTGGLAPGWEDRHRVLLEVAVRYEEEQFVVTEVRDHGRPTDELPPVGSRIVAISNDDGEMKSIDDFELAEVRRLLNSPEGTERRIEVALPEDGPRKTFLVTQARAPPMQHTQHITALQFNPTTTRLASTSWDSQVLLYSMSSPGYAQNASGFGDDSMGVAFSADDRFLAVAGSDGKIRIYDRESGKRTALLEGHTSAIRGIRFLGDGKRLLSCSWDGTARLWDAAEGREIATVARHERAFVGMDVREDGEQAFLVDRNGNLYLLDLPDGSLRSATNIPSLATPAVAYRPGHDQVAIGTIDGRVFLWESNAGRSRLVRQFRLHTGLVWGASFTPDGSSLATAGSDGTVKIVDAESGTLSPADMTRSFESSVSGTRTLRFAPDEGPLIIHNQTRVAFHDPISGRELPRPGGLLERFGDGWMDATAVSADCRQIVFGARDGRLRVVDAVTGELEKRIPEDDESCHRGEIRLIALSRDGRIIASADAKKSIRLWDAATGKLLREIKAEGGDTSNVLEFDPQASLLVSLYGSHKMQVWDTQSGESVAEIEGDRPYSVTFWEDGSRMLVGGFFGVINVWEVGRDVETNQRTLTNTASMLGHRGPVLGFAWNVPRNRVASAGGDGTVIVWDPDSREELVSLGPVRQPITSVAFRPDGMGLVAADGNGRIVRLYDTPALSVMETEGDRWQHHHVRGHLHTQLQQWSRAIASYSRAIDLGGTDRYLWRNRGWAHARRGDEASAMSDFLEVLTRRPDDGASWLCWYAARAMLAPDEVMNFIDGDPGRAGAFAGVLLSGRHPWDSAKRTERLEPSGWEFTVADLTDLIEDPDVEEVPWRVYFARGLAYAGLRKYRDAEADFLMAARLADQLTATPDSTPAADDDGAAGEDRDADDQAEGDAEEPVRENDEQPEANQEHREKADAELWLPWMALARSRAEQDEWTNAIEACDRAIAAGGKSWQLWYLRGMCHRFLRNWSAAADDYRDALERTEATWPILADHSYVLVKLGDAAAAAEALRQAHEQVAEDSEACYELAGAGMVAGDQTAVGSEEERQRALEIYEQTMQMMRDTVRRDRKNSYLRQLWFALNRVGDARNKSGDHHGAVAVYNEGLERIREADHDPSYKDVRRDFATSYMKLADVYCELRRFADAAALAKDRVEIRRTLHEESATASTRRELATALGSLAWYQIYNQQPEEVVKTSEEAIRLDSTMLWLRTNLAHGYLFSDKYDAAENLYLKYKDADMGGGKTFAETVLEDFEAFAAKGVTHPDMERIKVVLTP